MSSYQDRSEGVLLGTAAGDALGASFEFKPPVHATEKVFMRPSAIWKAGEWTDDTSMAIAIAEVAARGEDLRDEAAQDAIVQRWHNWSQESPDVGVQTRTVLGRASPGGEITAALAREESRRLHEETGRTAGNGSLMRTSPVALAYLHDEEAMVQAARTLSDLTHADPMAGDACVIWCSAIRHAVLTGEIDVRIGLRHVVPERRAEWETYLDEAEASRPADFVNNGFVVQALQGAWSAIYNTAEPDDDPGTGVFRADRLRRGLEAAVRGGRDADTVAAIAGGLLGAAYGASAVPLEWRSILNGWPNATARTLVRLASAIGRKGRPDTSDLSYRHATSDRLVGHPYDDRVVLGTVGVLRNLPPDITAAVSMCRLLDSDIRTDMPHVEVRLIDKEEPDENAHLDFVLLQTVQAVERLRAEGHTVLLHCVAAASRTPTIAALYGLRLAGVTAEQALDDLDAALHGFEPNRAFRAALRRLEHLRPGEVA
jgi:ADP-ribosyl-[dinitrogen reductase] hydrolase